MIERHKDIYGTSWLCAIWDSCGRYLIKAQEWPSLLELVDDYRWHLLVCVKPVYRLYVLCDGCQADRGYDGRPGVCLSGCVALETVPGSQ